MNNVAYYYLIYIFMSLNLIIAKIKYENCYKNCME